MVIDCDSCTMRDIACEDCIVTFLTIPVGPPAAPPGPLRALPPPAAGPPDLGEDERTAIAVLAGSGLVPPLRMVCDAAGPGPEPGGPAAAQAPPRSAAASA